MRMVADIEVPMVHGRPCSPPVLGFGAVRPSRTHPFREVTPVSTRPVVTAEPRDVVGKSVNSLRRQGLLPAVVYGHGKASTPIQLDARAFDELMRHVTRNTLVDLKVGSGRATPVLLQGIHEHPVRRHP